MEETQGAEKTSKSRTRKVLWFNPPYSKGVKTNVGKLFLDLVDECFYPTHPLSKIFNRSTIKVSYSCLPNMGSRIAGQNKKKTKPNTPAALTNCTCSKEPCPVTGECTKMDVIYQAIVTDQSNTKHKYLGKTSTNSLIDIGTT